MSIADKKTKLKKLKENAKNPKLKEYWEMFEKGIAKLEKEIGADAKKGEDILDRAFSDKPMPKAKPKAKAKAKAKPKAKKKTSVSKADAEKELAKKVGKTEEECEDILKQFRDLRAKKKARTKKTSETKAKSKAQGKTEPSGEITPEAVINDATKKVEKKIDKKIEKVEAKAEKTEKPKADATPKAKKEAEKKVEKKVEKETKVVAKDSVDALEGMVKAIMDSLKKYDKATAKLSLIKLRDAIDKEIAKYGDGGMVQGFDIQASLINVGNNPSYAKGGEVITDSFGDKYELREDEEININDYVYFGDTGDISVVEDEEDLEFARAGKTKAVPFAKGGKTPSFKGKILTGVSVDDDMVIVSFKDKPNDEGIIHRLLVQPFNSNDKLKTSIFFSGNDFMYLDNNKTYAKGGTLDVPNLNDGDFVETYAEGGRLDMELLDYNIGGALAVASQVKGVAPKSVDGIDSYIGNKFRNKAKMDDFWNTSPNERKARGYAKGGKIDKDIAKFKKQLIAKEKSRGLYENFGRNEVRKLNDKYDAYEMGDDGVKNYTKIQEFSDWASGFDGTRYEKGGMSQGYNDKDDESIGMRNRGNKMQSRKDRRDESAGMEESGGRRKYADVGTMDKGRRKKMEAGGGLGNIAKPFNIQEGMISVGNNVKFFKKGGGLYDNLKIKKGTFTKKAKNRGMTTKAFMKEVLSNPENYTMKTRRQAQLMKNMM